MDDFEIYHQWLASGKSPDDIEQDLMSRGFSADEARKIATHIDNSYLADLTARKPIDGTLYRVIGWFIIFFGFFSTLYFVPIIFIWYAYGLVGGLGFAFLRYASKLERGTDFRQGNFKRKFTRQNRH